MPELAVGAMGAGKERGAVYILFMNKDGTVKKTSLIGSLYGWDHKLNVQVQCVFFYVSVGAVPGGGSWLDGLTCCVTWPPILTKS